MDEFIEYQKFPSIDDARYLIDLLDANQIPFKIEDSATRFDLSARSINPLEFGIVLQVKQIDKDRVDQINFRTIETASVNDHYMYSLSDNDIIDVIVNSEDWTEEEISLAKEISKQRNLKISAEQIKLLRKDKISEINKEKTKQTNIISGGSSWFLWIGILSALNVVTVIFRSKISFVFGLGFNYTIMGAFDGIRRASGIDLMPLSFFLAFVVSGIFILIWKKSKQKNKNYYLTGLIIYGMDTVFSLLLKDWYSFGFHLFAMLGLYTGYKALLNYLSESRLAEDGK